MKDALESALTALAYKFIRKMESEELAEKIEQRTCDRPTLTDEQIKKGFHIYKEFRVHDDAITYDALGKKCPPTTKVDLEHWKKCPCGRDSRLK